MVEPCVRIGLRALGRNWRRVRGTGWILALLASIGHAAEQPRNPVAGDIFYLHVVSGKAGGPDNGAAIAFADDACEWEDPPLGATVGCVMAVVEGARQRIAVRHVDAEGEPLAAEDDLEFQYSTRPISAMAGADYVSATGTVTIMAGEFESSPSSFTTIDDVIDEHEESFAVELKGDPEFPVDLEFDFVVVPIADNDPEVRLSVEGGDAAEDAGVLSFEVSLNGQSGKTVTVDFATTDGTATAGADYHPAVGTLMFEPGEVTSTVDVTVIDDTVQELVEWFELELSNAQNARLPRWPGRGTIRDDEVSLTITPARTTEGSGPLEFTVSATGLVADSAQVSVRYATADGTATAGADYEAVSGVLRFTAAHPAQVVAVPLVDDAVDEPDETLRVVLTDAVNASIAKADVVGVIEDDDPLAELRISGGSGEEGERVGFVVELSGSTARTVTVEYATRDGTAAAGGDYVPASGKLTFEPGKSSASVAVDTVDDEIVEPEETFLARLSSPVNAVIVAGEAAGTIIDDDEEPAAVATRPEDPMLCVGGAPARIDLSRYVSGTNLSYAVAAPDPTVARASLEGAVLTLMPVAEGTTSVMVTATNSISDAAFELTVTVVADPAELAAIERGLAVTGGLVLADIVDAISDRFVDSETSGGSSNAPASAPSTFEDGGPPGVFAHGRANDLRSLPARKWSATRPPAGAPDNLLLGAGSSAFSANPPSDLGRWSVWGRGSARRLDAGEALRDGSLTTLQVGADTRIGGWLVGAAGALGRADAEYGFMRSMDACGGDGEGAGVLEAEMVSVHPYVGRQMGRGWLWGTAGVGGGEAVVKRCESGQRTAADVSMRMGALGGRHVIRGGDRVEVSLVEDLGMLRATTGTAGGPVGDHDVSVGRARLGVEARGVCATRAGIIGWARAFARHDWGDGIEGSGAEVALGARLNAPQRRVRLEAAVHAVAVHTEDSYREHGANVAAAYLPRVDGTGLQVSMALRRGAPAGMGRLEDGWQPPLGSRKARNAVRGDMSVGVGFRIPGGLARPFAELGMSNRGRSTAAGLRYVSLARKARFIGEVSMGHRRGIGDGRFVIGRFEARW